MTTQCLICDTTTFNPIFTVGAIVIVLGVLYFLVRYVHNHSYVTPANPEQMMDNIGEGAR